MHKLKYLRVIKLFTMELLSFSFHVSSQVFPAVFNSELGINSDATIERLELINPFPNPFNNIVNILFKIDKPDVYLIKIFNLKGEQVFSEKKYFNTIGSNQFYFDFKDASSGAYFIQLEGNKSIKTSKIILLK